jgi:hypothetical protein
MPPSRLDGAGPTRHGDQFQRHATVTHLFKHRLYQGVVLFYPLQLLLPTQLSNLFGVARPLDSVLVRRAEEPVRRAKRRRIKGIKRAHQTLPDAHKESVGARGGQWPSTARTLACPYHGWKKKNGSFAGPVIDKGFATTDTRVYEYPTFTSCKTKE